MKWFGILLLTILLTGVLSALPVCAAGVDLAGWGPAYVWDRDSHTSGMGLGADVIPIKGHMWPKGPRWEKWLRFGGTAEVYPDLRIGLGPGVVIGAGKSTFVLAAGYRPDNLNSWTPNMVRASWQLTW